MTTEVLLIALVFFFAINTPIAIAIGIASGAALAAAVVEAGGKRIRLAPPTDLEELAAVLGGSSLVVGGDTGPVHLAASFGVPTVAVFLASDWRRNGPLGPRTAVVSGAGESQERPSGSARTAPLRPVTSQEIISAALDLFD